MQAVALVSPQSQTIDGSSPGAAGGLLGAVKKESVTGDHLVEAGPLTVATHGVCCIQHLEKLTVHHTVSSISSRKFCCHTVVFTAACYLKPGAL